MDVTTKKCRKQRKNGRIRRAFRRRKLTVLEGLPKGPTKPRKVH